MQNPTRFFISVCFFILLVCGCKTYSVLNSDYDRTVDFGSYHTYGWLPVKDNDSSTYRNTIIPNNIKNYLAHHFEEFGYKADTENPDLLFEIVNTSINKTSTTLYTEQNPSPNFNYQNNPYYLPNPNPNDYNNFNNYNYNYNNQNYSGNNGYGYNSYTQVNRTDKYVENTFTLNAIDRKRKQLVWTCTVQADIYNKSYIESDIHPAVHTMLKTYPAKPLKQQRKTKHK